MPPESATQTLPAPYATLPGELPMGKARETRPPCRSLSSKRPVPELVTQIPRPQPPAQPVLPSAMVARVRPLRESILDSVLSVTLATQTDP